MKLGKVHEAEQQLDFLSAVQESGGRHPQLLLLSAMLAAKKGSSESKTVSMLLQTATEHMAAVGNQFPTVAASTDVRKGYTPEYYVAFNPDLGKTTW